jgi:hypothetical protein
VLRDLQDPSFADITWTVIAQDGRGLRDREPINVVAPSQNDTSHQLLWLTTRNKQAAPQPLTAAR